MNETILTQKKSTFIQPNKDAAIEIYMIILEKLMKTEISKDKFTILLVKNDKRPAVIV